MIDKIIIMRYTKDNFTHVVKLLKYILSISHNINFQSQKNYCKATDHFHK